ncbi:winged helix-turn-helix domain-containing protein [Streptomyces sp. NBC_00879]|uniref:AfsR/SARP family transcriptional regulator n=1 Tax=Streptomyces sp. NBC_00879 TaxID=2975855 RepID=UPI003865F90C|nr:winged helix-turn-helix domain-containing protein [Streptomyces sp. NBC_00879]
MHYRVLGTTQALHDDGTPVALGGARLRALLTVLALRAGRTVPVGVLVDEVWDGDPPADAVGAVQALVGRLRRALGHAAVASADSGGYRLCAAGDDVDLHRFDRLAGEGVRALDEGDAVKAAALLDDALALWQGPVLADLPDRTPEAARWEARRLDTRRARLAAALALGRAEEALPELAALCEAHPLDERLQGLRLRALRDAGRAAQALAAYEEVRRLLADSLGADPGHELRALHRELLSHSAPPATTRAADTPPVPAPRPYARGNLRARLTSFVGRDADIEAIHGDLAAARLVTLLGPGGAGKTRLSQEAAERVAATGQSPWPDGVWLAELAPVDDPETVPEAVLSALGARETVLRGAGAEELRAAEGHSDDAVLRLTEHCARRRMLLLLDNCEHVVGAAAALAERLLESCPGVTVLATSREPLGVPGELVRPVDPLPDPMALRLLAERGAAARPGFRTEDDPEAAAEICHRLDGLPLAIELAAARLRMLTPRQIADRLDDRFRLLTSGSRTVLPRQQTLRAVVDWSWDLLDDAERAVLPRLSVFAGGCDLAAAEAVCAEPGADLDVADVLGSLIDKSLVVAAPTPDGQMRYRLLETVGEYAAERLDQAAERAAVERRHLVHYRELVRATDPLLRGSGQRAAVGLLQLEYENLRTALRRAVAARDEQEALFLVVCLTWYWQMRDLRTEARHWATAAGELGPDPFAPPVQPAPPISERFTDAPPPMSPELLQEARRGAALIRLVFMDYDMDDWTTPEKMEVLRRITQTYRPGLPQTCRPPASFWFFAVVMTAETAQLQNLLDKTTEAARAFGNEWELAVSLQLRANVLANRSEWAGDAARDADEALEIFTRIGDDYGAAEALSARAEARERNGEYPLAAEDFTAAIGYAEQVGAQVQTAVLRSRLGGVLLEMGEDERGEAMIRDVLADSRGAGSDSTVFARLYLALWLGRTGRIPQARVEIDLLLTHFQSTTVAIFDGMITGFLARLDLVEGEYEMSLSRVRYALEKARDPLTLMVAPQMPSLHLATAAGALVLRHPERAPDAARILGASDALLPRGHFSPRYEREGRADSEAAVRAALGDAAYESAYAEGGSLTLDEAAALV